MKHKGPWEVFDKYEKKLIPILNELFPDFKFKKKYQTLVGRNVNDPKVKIYLDFDGKNIMALSMRLAYEPDKLKEMEFIVLKKECEKHHNDCTNLLTCNCDDMHDKLFELVKVISEEFKVKLKDLKEVGEHLIAVL